MSDTERAWALLELAEVATQRRDVMARHRAAVIEAVRAGVDKRTVARVSGISHVTVAKWWRERP